MLKELLPSPFKRDDGLSASPDTSLHPARSSTMSSSADFEMTIATTIGTLERTATPTTPDEDVEVKTEPDTNFDAEEEEPEDKENMPPKQRKQPSSHASLSSISSLSSNSSMTPLSKGFGRLGVTREDSDELFTPPKKSPRGENSRGVRRMSITGAPKPTFTSVGVSSLPEFLSRQRSRKRARHSTNSINHSESPGAGDGSLGPETTPKGSHPKPFTFNAAFRMDMSEFEHSSDERIRSSVGFREGLGDDAGGILGHAGSLTTGHAARPDAVGARTHMDDGSGRVVLGEWDDRKLKQQHDIFGDELMQVAGVKRSRTTARLTAAAAGEGPAGGEPPGRSWN